jgi:hypothetical protein
MGTKKTELVQKNEDNVVYSDSEPEDNEDTANAGDTFDNEIMELNSQYKYKTEIKKFNVFMRELKCETTKGDPNTNIVDLLARDEHDNVCTKMYCVPDTKIPRMFKHLESCRGQNATMMVYEKQQEYSGFMIDFDIYQSTDKDHLGQAVIVEIVKIILNSVIKYVNLAKPNIPYDSDKITIYAAVTKKPEVKYVESKGCYKNGIHVLLPGIKITREVKRFILGKFQQEDVFAEIFEDHDIAAGHNTADFVDMNSAHVPVYFVGSSTKPGQPKKPISTAYKLVHILSTDISIAKLEKSNHAITIVNDCTADINPHTVRKDMVLVHELSLNWENTGTKTNPFIKKYEYDIKESYIGEVNIIKKSLNKTADEDVEQEYGNLSSLNLHDPEAGQIEKLLNILHDDRNRLYTPWFKVLCALAHTSASYKPLAVMFSKKCPEKFTESGFEHHWNAAQDNKANGIKIGSLYYWARLDNPAEYEKITNCSLFTVVNNMVYKPQLEGSLQHFNVATILHLCQRHKFVYDNKIWYEFMIKGDKIEDGEIYKWRKYAGIPNSLRLYISKILPDILQKVLDNIDKRLGSAEGDLAKYLIKVRKNLKITSKLLGDHSFKSKVLKEAEILFHSVGFANKLDIDKDIMGVGNGILKLGKKIEFIDEFHQYNTSLSTNVKYKPFNPFDETTRSLLITIRNLFPDDEPDSFEFFMCYVASTLDGKIKESMLLMLVGAGSNGKTFIMNLVKETIGTYGIKMQLAFLTSRPKNSENATPALMSLKKARLAFYSETDRMEVLNLPKVKEITGQEILCGRNLYGAQENFRPTCHHVVTSNYDFEVHGNDHGTWRRLKRLEMKIKFCKPNVDNYNENNPYERLANLKFGAAWQDDPEVKSSFLSILCHYYMLLQNKYDGVVENVPHPHINAETEAFRDKQDKINMFINTMIIKLSDTATEKDIADGVVVDIEKITMALLIVKYTQWHQRLYPDDRVQGKYLMDQFESSRLSPYIKKDKREPYIVGVRILDTDNDILHVGETSFKDISVHGKKAKEPIITEKESSSQYYDRICNEYREATEKARQDQAELAKIKVVPRVIHEASSSLITPSKPQVDLREYDKSGIRIPKPIDDIDYDEFSDGSDFDDE